MPLTQDCPASLINLTTEQYNSTGMHIISLWLAILTSEQQRRALECAFVAPNSMQKYTLPCLPQIYWKPPKYGCFYILNTQCGPHGVRIREVPLYID